MIDLFQCACRRSLAVLASLVLTGFGAALAQQSESSSMALSDVGATPIAWEGVDAEPAWLKKAARHAGMFAFATVRRSNLMRLAIARAENLAERDVRGVLFEHLLPVLGEKHVLPVVEVLLKHVQLLEAKTEGPTKIPGARGPGQTICHAYMRWQISIRDAVRELPPAVQGRVEWILLRDVVPWESVAQPPKWASKPPHKKGQFRFVLSAQARLPNESKQAAFASIGYKAQGCLAKLMAPAFGGEQGVPAQQRALARLAPVRRATWFRTEVATVGRPVTIEGSGRKPTKKVATSYVLWEVPVATLLEGLTDEESAKVQKALAEAAAR